MSRDAAVLKIAIVGFGGMGQVHAANYAKIAGCQVVATVNNSEAGMAKAKEMNLPSYSTLSELVAQVDVDVVDICTPTFKHKELVLEALELGKHVIVEKPMALHKADAREMFDKAREKGRLLFVAQVLQFTKEVEILRSLVRENTLGKPLDGYFERLAGRPEWSQGGWLFDKEKSGVLPFDLHVHDLDIIVSLFGEPMEVSYTFSKGEKSDMAEQYRFVYLYPDKTMAAEAAWYNADFPFTARWRVYFEEGLLVQDGQSLTLYQKGKEPMVYDTTEEILVSTGINLPPTGMFHRELSHFLHCIREGIPSPVVSEKQILTTIKLLEKITF